MILINNQVSKCMNQDWSITQLHLLQQGVGSKNEL